MMKRPERFRGGAAPEITQKGSEDSDEALMHEILCSTGALIGRPNGRDYRLLEVFVPRLECDGLEFMFYPNWYDGAEELQRRLKDWKFHIPVFHCEKSLSEHISRGGEAEMREARRLFHLNCRTAEAAGADRMVFHLWNGIISDSRFENNLNAFGEFRETAARYGLDLLVENVICRQDPMSHWVELVRKYPDIHLIFDTKMADFHRQLALLYAPEYAWLQEHIRHYHVNDYGGGYRDWENLSVLPVGKGHIDFGAFFDHIRKTGYRGDFTFEATGFDASGTVDTDMLNRQFAAERELLSAPDGT